MAQMVKQNISQAVPHPQITFHACTTESSLEVKTIMKNRAFHTTVCTEDPHFTDGKPVTKARLSSR